MTIIKGKIWNDGFRYGTIKMDDQGIITDVKFEEPEDRREYTDMIFPPMVDCHTHVGDAGLKLDRKYSIQELVAPPDGLKHRYLEEADNDTMLATMKKYVDELKKSGVTKIVDFREGGYRGCDLLRQVDPDATILGRPITPDFDSNEMDMILSVADGIGISSISDYDRDYLDGIVQHVHKEKKILGIHVSERKHEDFKKILALEPDFVVHMCCASDAELKACADNDIPIVICPRSNFYFGLVTPVGKMVKAGAEIVLGTDNACISSPNYMEEIEMTKYLVRRHGLDEKLAYKFAFSNKGKSLNARSLIRDQIGKRANMTVVSERYGKTIRYC